MRFSNDNIFTEAQKVQDVCNDNTSLRLHAILLEFLSPLYTSKLFQFFLSYYPPQKLSHLTLYNLVHHFTFVKIFAH